MGSVDSTLALIGQLQVQTWRECLIWSLYSQNSFSIIEIIEIKVEDPKS